jgi:hypothetical protein
MCYSFVRIATENATRAGVEVTFREGLAEVSLPAGLEQRIQPRRVQDLGNLWGRITKT